MVTPKVMKPITGSVWLAGVSLLAVACVEPAPPSPESPLGETAVVPTAEAPSTEGVVTSAEPSALPAAGVAAAQSWAERVCGQGPYSEPPHGVIKPTKIANSEPTALDPKDKGFHLYEGAVWFQGKLHFSDFKTTEGFPSRILQLDGATLKVAIPDSGSNGLALDPSGEHLVAARHSSKSPSVYKDGKFEPLATSYQGKVFNSPNDVVFRSDGNLYFTDPSFQAGDRIEQATTNVYRVAPSGEVTAIDTTIRNPNGVSLSPDENTLYVAGNMEQGFVRKYAIAEDGSVSEGTLFLDKVTVPDGMAVDCAGNVYVTEHTNKRVRIVSPEGKPLAEIKGMDQNVTNVAFGGAEHKTLFITTTGRLFQVEMPIPGMPY